MMHYLEGTISSLLLVQKFLDLSILKNYIEMTKTLELFRYDYYVFHGFLFKKSMLSISKCSIRDLLFREAHGGVLMGHSGINKTYHMLH